MKIEVGELLKRIGNKQRIMDKASLTFPEDGLDIKGPVTVDVTLTNIGKAVLMTGKIEAMVGLSCVRCLRVFEQRVSMDVNEEYSKESSVLGGEKDELEIKDEDIVFPISEDNSIDLTEAIRQNLLTALPIKPLCRRSCRGLDEATRERKNGVDPRLAGLKDLKSKLRRT